MLSVLPPGIKFLSRGIAYVAVYVGGAIGIARLADNLSSGYYYVPVWMAVTGALAAVPTLSALYILSGELHKERRAAALGARTMPKAPSKWIGSFDLLKMNLKNLAIGYPGDGLTEIVAQRGNTFNFRVLWSDVVFTSCPEHIKTILASDFQNYVKGTRLIHDMSSVLGAGVFNSDGDMWKFHRSITRPVFSRDRITDFDIFDHHTTTAIHKLKERLREGHAVDFQDLMARFTLDSATQFLFGHCVHSLDAGLPYPHNVSSYTTQGQTQSAGGKRADDFAKAFAEAQHAISVRVRVGWIWPLFEMFEDKTVEPMKIVNAYMEPIIQDAVERKKVAVPQESGNEQELQEGQTLLDHLMTVTKDPVLLRDEILNIMIAGRDTTAATLTFAIYCLARHPEVMQRLRVEILDRLGPSRGPSFDDLRELKYLRAVINETLRLFPIVPFNMRESVHETTWPSLDPNNPTPLYIPEGTKTSYSVFLMHRREDLWGPDAQEFDPDRFLDERLKKYLLKNSFIFLPFNAGPRICLGQQYAYNEMSFMLVRLMQTFSGLSLDLDSAPPEAHPPAHWANDKGTRKATEKVWPKMHLTMYANGGLWVKFQEAKDLEV